MAYTEAIYRDLGGLQVCPAVEWGRNVKEESADRDERSKGVRFGHIIDEFSSEKSIGPARIISGRSQ